MPTSSSATRRALLTALIGAAGLVAVPGTAVAAPVTTTFTYTGAPQTFTVPAGVRTIHAIAIGGAGGTGSEYGPGIWPGGHGARVEADLGVTPGQLEVRVGGNGTNGRTATGGYNGGGDGGGYGYLIYDTTSGGGASDIRTTPGDLASRILVAGGGGGGGTYTDAGPGGDAGSPGSPGSYTGPPEEPAPTAPVARAATASTADSAAATAASAWVARRGSWGPSAEEEEAAATTAAAAAAASSAAAAVRASSDPRRPTRPSTSSRPSRW